MEKLDWVTIIKIIEELFNNIKKEFGKINKELIKVDQL